VANDTTQSLLTPGATGPAIQDLAIALAAMKHAEKLDLPTIEL
jgi:hypothetical protein